MKKLALGLAAAGLAACLSVGCLTAGTASAQTPIKIGFIATFSGTVGTLGQDQYDAFMLAVEQRGGKLGGVPVQVIKEDDQFKPELAAQLAQKLIDRENVPIITGITASNVIMAIAKPITDRQVFLLSTNSGPSPLAGAQCSPYLYVVSWQGDNISEVVGKYATTKGYGRMVLIAPNYQAGKDVLGGFKRMYRRPIVEEFYTGLNQLDYSAEIAQIAALKPEAVFAFLPGGFGINFLRQYQQAGLLKTVPLLTTGVIDGTTLPALKETALGVLGGAFWGPDMNNPVSQQFVAAFEKKYGRIPSTFAAQAYDGALLLDSAIARTGGDMADKQAFGAALQAADFRSVRGKFRFNTNHFPIHDMHMYEAVKGPTGQVVLKQVATPLTDHADAYSALCPLK